MRAKNPIYFSFLPWRKHEKTGVKDETLPLTAASHPHHAVEQMSRVFFLQVKIYMKVDLHMVGCRQFAGVRRLA